MSHTNTTTNFGLPQFITTDKPAWLTDVNVAYAAIDTAMKNNQTAAASAQGDATQALTDAGNAQTAANTADAKASGAIASISEAFLDSATYAVGELVIYNNLLYVCHTAVETPGAWTGSTNWTRTDVDTLLGNTPKALGDLDNVDINTPSAGQIFAYDGSNWENTNIDNILPSTTTPTIYATKTSGAWNIDSITAKQNYKTVEIQIVIGGTNTSVASGAEGFIGNISSRFPLTNMFAVTYYGSNIFVLRLQSDGTVYVRNVNSSAFTLPTGDSFTFGFTYLTT